MKGKFRPKHPEKYKGDPAGITYRSSWELKLMGTLDNNPDVIEWSSEELNIKYRSPIDGKIHRYFPDFVVKKKNASDGRIVTVMIEVKPAYQTVPPKVQSGKPSKRYITEVHNWGVNSAKWKAAEEYCLDKGWQFIKMTEYDLGIKS